METVDNAKLDFYPAFCFKASPTHFAWVKMAAVDVHRLKRRPGFEGQNIYFYQNHPIRFVCLVGVIVARTDVYKRTILTLDDSSGATIDIVAMKPDPNQQKQHQQPQHQNRNISNKAQQEEETHITATEKTPLDITTLTPGTVAKIKGTLSTFRNSNQLQLERHFAVPDTNAEMRFLDQRVRILVEVLSVPWVVSSDEVEELRVEAEYEEEKVEEVMERARRKVRRRAEREERDQRRIQKMWEREERVRKWEAVSCQVAGRRVMRELEKRKGNEDGRG